MLVVNTGGGTNGARVSPCCGKELEEAKAPALAKDG